jgi:hypothetical protein
MYRPAVGYMYPTEQQHDDHAGSPTLRRLPIRR